MAKAGEVKLLSLVAAGLGTKAELGAVSDWALETTQAAPDPLPETVQPAGRTGAVTPSKFWARKAGLTGFPNLNGKETVPKFTVPSCSWSVAVFVPPQIPVVVKVNARVTVGPPTAKAP